ncbi:hypothetical protein C4D60_Mb10t21850 [Musa balbisiana]|uniref:adenylate kinase n=1 Tax=Musa balbisiana TaxID=52838 RepID=A0A4S8IYS8_MUSBA|nr:hypothetical protein C4D60_Mb10t21850 [Musa balbisiana]
MADASKGRADDNTETMRKRFRVFKESTLPVIKHYDLKGKVRKVDAAKPVDEVFEDVKVIFAPLIAKVMWSCKEDNSSRHVRIELGRCASLFVP